MQKQGGRVLFSAGDVVAFLECEHATTLALTHLETPLEKAEDDASLELIQNKGFAHDGRSDFLRRVEEPAALCRVNSYSASQ